MSVYDAAASTFARDRALPDDAAEKIRAAVLAAVEAPSPRLLDLGAGGGRIGWPFVAAGDDYVGVDLSLAMLRAFMRRTGQDAVQVPRLVQADGAKLPFADAMFDAVLLIQVFGGMRGWRRVLTEARRVLRGMGTLMLGRTVAPPDGVDAQMRQHLAAILEDMGVRRDRMNARDDAQGWLERTARGTRLVAATWNAERTPRGFLDRHRTGARFSVLPEPVKDEALRKLGAWAAATFGSLDAVFSEPHAFELQAFKFVPTMAGSPT